MNVKSMEFLLELAQMRGLFGIIAALFLIVAVITLGSIVVDRIKVIRSQSRKQRTLELESIKNLNYNKVKDERKSDLLRQMVSADAINPAPNNYLIIEDGGVEMYTRTFTIASLPKTTIFAQTFSTLFDFPGCTSSVFVEPVSESKMISKMDRQITILGSEWASAQGDPNRTRKIQAQYNEMYAWAEQLEAGESKFFEVGFAFTLSAQTFPELNKICGSFRTKALEKGITISNAYAVQAEAFVQNAPFNRTINIGSKNIKTDAIKTFYMDKFAVSTIFNYTQSSFSHKEGIPLGRNMDNGSPIFYDLFDASHDGFTLVIAGKTGSGKSATIKMYVARSILYDFHYVCIDSQQRKGTNEGEFASIAQLVNGVNFKIANGSDNVMNPFEVGETTKTVKDSYDSVREIRTLELNDKISMAVHNLLTMIQGNKGFATLENTIPVKRILTDITSSLYQEFGLKEGDADSLYREGQLVKNGMLTSGRVKKELPTMSDFYKRALIASKVNKDKSLELPYNLVLMGLKDYVKEIYYTEKTYTFLTKEEVERCRFRDAKENIRVYVNKDNKEEDIISVIGIRAYYDGQSNVEISPECPFTNIDISLLPEQEKILARQIAFDYVNESFIKKNSESVRSARKLVAIFDECHENFAFEYCRKTLDNVVRTARKRHCGIMLSSQTLAEYRNYDETQAILKQATSKFVFKQDYQDRKYILDTLGITETQVDYIINKLGGNSSSEEDKNKHRGEVCIVDGTSVAFCKVDYLKETEALAVDTDAREIEKLMRVVS